jgi:hypothetical protein
MNDQRSVADQLNDLHALAIERGMYDAADWLKRRANEYWPDESRSASSVQKMDDPYKARAQ